MILQFFLVGPVKKKRPDEHHVGLPVKVFITDTSQAFGPYTFANGTRQTLMINPTRFSPQKMAL